MSIAKMLGQNPREVAAAQAAQARAAAQDAAQQARDAARDQAEAARDIARAKLDAARAEQEAQRIGDGDGDGEETTVVTVTKDGVTMTLKDASPQAIATALGMPDPYADRQNNEWVAIPVVGILMTAIVMTTWLVLRYRAQVRGVSSAATLPTDLTQRLSRMEAGIESMAVEVERISEGQRFTTRLLAERPQGEEVRRG